MCGSDCKDLLRVRFSSFLSLSLPLPPLWTYILRNPLRLNITERNVLQLFNVVRGGERRRSEGRRKFEKSPPRRLSLPSPSRLDHISHTHTRTHTHTNTHTHTHTFTHILFSIAIERHPHLFGLSHSPLSVCFHNLYLPSSPLSTLPQHSHTHTHSRHNVGDTPLPERVEAETAARTEESARCCC